MMEPFSISLKKPVSMGTAISPTWSRRGFGVYTCPFVFRRLLCLWTWYAICLHLFIKYNFYCPCFVFNHFLSSWYIMLGMLSKDSGLLYCGVTAHSYHVKRVRRNSSSRVDELDRRKSLFGLLLVAEPLIDCDDCRLLSWLWEHTISADVTDLKCMVHQLSKFSLQRV